jgi:hypothetical protein
MSPQAQFVLLAWLPLTLYLFNRFPPAKAMMVSLLGAMLFLPQRTSFSLPVIPDYKGASAAIYSIIIGILIYDSERFSKFEAGWIDLPMLIWCICPMFTSISNGLGAYDGFNSAIRQTMEWGLPYFLGRLYLGNLARMEELAINALKGGLLYVPLCLWEGKMAPLLHMRVYGYMPHTSGLTQSIRYGGWRPNVFMSHGLQVGLWMFTIATIGIWLYQAKVLKKVWAMSMKWLIWVLVFTVIWCRATGAYFYLLFAMLILFTAKFARTGLPLLLLLLGISFHLYLNVTGQFDGDGIVDLMTQLTNEDRASSLAFRFRNEDILGEHARDRMILGWGGWGRNRVLTLDWKGDLVDETTVDSLWIAIFGVNGLVGIASWSASMLLPVVSFMLLRYPAKTWLNPQVAPAAALATTLALFMLDSMVNAMYLPVFSLASGGLAGIVLKNPESLKPKKRSARKTGGSIKNLKLNPKGRRQQKRKKINQIR